MKYGFYSKNDNNREIIMTHEFTDIIQAVDFFSKVKVLSVNTFLDLYNVIPVTKNEPDN